MVAESNNKELLDRVEEDGAKCEKEMHACARCALLAVARNLKLAEDDCIDAALRTAIPLSGGIAGTRNHCGALVGGVMAIGLAMVKGNPREAAVEERKASMAVSKRFYRWFEKEIGQVRCYDIRDAGLGRSFDTSDPEETKKFEAAGGYELCSGVVGKAARKAAEMILEWQKA
jgi:C_GCAxxG_C_C family probable redox protein